MKLSAPTQVVFIIAVIIAIVGLIAFFVPSVAVYAFWIMTLAFVVLAVGCLLTGM